MIFNYLYTMKGLFIALFAALLFVANPVVGYASDHSPTENAINLPDIKLEVADFNSVEFEVPNFYVCELINVGNGLAPPDLGFELYSALSNRFNKLETNDYFNTEIEDSYSGEYVYSWRTNGNC